MPDLVPTGSSRLPLRLLLNLSTSVCPCAVPGLHHHRTPGFISLPAGLPVSPLLPCNPTGVHPTAFCAHDSSCLTWNKIPSPSQASQALPTSPASSPTVLQPPGFLDLLLPPGFLDLLLPPDFLDLPVSFPSRTFPPPGRPRS